MLRTKSRRRDESGAVAVMFGLLAVMLMSVAALGVDIGNEVTRHTVTQTQADFAAFAGGDQMTAVGAVGSTPSAAIVNAVVAALNNNQPQDDSSSVQTCVKTKSCVKASDLTDKNLKNGEVRYTSQGLQVIAPNHYVAFGMARIMGFQGANVGARATVQIYSPGEHILPYFAAQNCDFGTQTISQPTNGLDATTINLNNPGPPNNTALENQLVTTPASPVGSAGVPYPVPAGTPLEIDGSNFTGVNKVGFFESGGAAVGPAPVTLPITAAMISGTNPTMKIKIPDISPANLSQDAWYVRVSTDNGVTWSAVGVGKQNATLNALPISVGSPNLVCATGSQTGNFGTLDLHNDSAAAPSGTGDNVAYNIAAGLSHQLAPYKLAASPWTCGKAGGSPAGTTVWPADPTNCIATQTGSVSGDDAYSGLIKPGWKTPAPTVPGLLANLTAGSGCAADGTPSTTFFNSVKINNDTLSCWFTDPKTTVGDVDTKTYSLSGPAFSSAIWTSPRFVWIPVISCPCTGNSTNYEIIDFRPAYITDQLNSATKSTPLTSCSNTVCNGLTLGQNGHSIAPLQVVLINIASLPAPPSGGPVSPYNGIGPPIVRLIN
jgi:hypothetical protein